MNDDELSMRAGELLSSAGRGGILQILGIWTVVATYVIRASKR
jgi:hypothetical protein